MKELFDVTILKNSILNKKEQIEKTQTLKFSITKIPGLKLFKQNKDTKEISECVFDNSRITIVKYGKNVVNHKILFEENYLYVQALNKKNAIKKFNKLKL